MKETSNTKIKELEEELSKTKYNKRTQFHVGLVKAKIAILKEKEVKRKSGGKKGEGYNVRKTGDGTVVLLGFPSVGKSTLLNKLTNAHSEVAAYAFTTLTCIPGLLNYKHAEIQVLDVPGIVKGAADGTGRGKEVLSVIRGADMVLMLIDVFYPEHYDVLKREVYDAGIRINAHLPDVKITKTIKGGIDIGSTVKLTRIDRQTITEVLKEFKIINASVVIREDIDVDQLIDVIEGNKVYIPSITILNKIDMVDKDHLHKVVQKIRPDLMVSAEKGINIDVLKDLIFERLGFMRIYLKETRKKADMDEPMIMKNNSTIKTVCEKLHKDFVSKFRFARVWGSSKFPGQDIRNLNYELKDNDVLELHIG